MATKSKGKGDLQLREARSGLKTCLQRPPCLVQEGRPVGPARGRRACARGRGELQTMPIGKNSQGDWVGPPGLKGPLPSSATNADRAEYARNIAGPPEHACGSLGCRNMATCLSMRIRRSDEHDLDVRPRGYAQT